MRTTCVAVARRLFRGVSLGFIFGAGAFFAGGGVGLGVGLGVVLGVDGGLGFENEGGLAFMVALLVAWAPLASPCEALVLPTLGPPAAE